MGFTILPSHRLPRRLVDIKNVAKTCESCVERAPSNRPEAERHHEPASYPFQFLHMDLAQHGGRYFLITVDQFSGYPNIFECGKTASTRQVTDHLLQLFATFSIPVRIYSDGGPQFLEGETINKFEFSQFCKEWGVQHVTSSPPRVLSRTESASVMAWFPEHP